MNKKIAISGLTIAMYVVMVGTLQSISFGAIQIRLANSLYALCAIYPFLVIPLGIAVILSNLIFGGLGIVDIVGGFLVTTITCYLVSKMKPSWIIILPIILVPGLLVPLWLSYLLKISYLVIMPGVLVGQVIPALLGVVVIKRLNNR